MTRAPASPIEGHPHGEPVPGMLYYPLINPPRAILHEAALYWDTLATIVPADEVVEFSDDVRTLHDAGLYRPITETPRLELDEVAPVLRQLWSQVPREDLLPPADTARDRRTRIIATKLTPELRAFLIAHGLARPGPDDGELVVSPTTQELVIGLAAPAYATLVGSLHPHTDQATAFRAATQPYTGEVELSTRPRRGTDSVEACWLVTLDNLLPVPAPEVPLDDVLAFRQRHEAERLRLVRGVTRLVRELRAHDDRPGDVLRAVEHELTAALDEFRRAARASRMTWLYRSLAVAIALGATAGVRPEPELSWLLGTVNGIAINIATGELRTSTAGWRHPDVAYLHRAHTRWAG